MKYQRRPIEYDALEVPAGCTITVEYNNPRLREPEPVTFTAHAGDYIVREVFPRGMHNNGGDPPRVWVYSAANFEKEFQPAQQASWPHPHAPGVRGVQYGQADARGGTLTVAVGGHERSHRVPRMGTAAEFAPPKDETELRMQVHRPFDRSELGEGGRWLRAGIDDIGHDAPPSGRWVRQGDEPAHD